MNNPEIINEWVGMNEEEIFEDISFSDNYQMKTVLIVGDSEASIFESAAERLERKFNVSLLVDSKPGRSILDSMEAVKKGFSGAVDILLLLGVTSFAWRKHPLEGAPGVNLITKNERAEWKIIVNFMETIFNFCQRKNSSALVYLILPSVKNIYAYNTHLLTKYNNLQYLPLMNEDNHFKEDSLICISRDIYENSLTLKGKEFGNWTLKKVLLMNNAFNHYAQNVLHYSIQSSPHTKFLRGTSSDFSFPEMLRDGLHYTTHCVEAFFDAIRVECPWLKLRRAVPSVPVVPTSLELYSTPAPVAAVSVSTAIGAYVHADAKYTSSDESLLQTPDMSSSASPLLLENTSSVDLQNVSAVRKSTVDIAATKHILDEPIKVEVLPHSHSSNHSTIPTPSGVNTRGLTSLTTQVSELSYLSKSLADLNHKLVVPPHCGEPSSRECTPISTTTTSPSLVKSPTSGVAAQVSSSPVLVPTLSPAKERQLWYYLQGIEHCLIPEDSSEESRWDILTSAQLILQSIKERKEYSSSS